MLFENATHSNCLACDFQYNVTGAEIAGGSGNTIAGGTAIGNSQYGIWLNGTTGNTVSETVPDQNNLAGIYLGCSAKGDVTPPIPCTTTATTGNELANNYSESGNAKYGIAVEKGSIGNEFLQNEALYNGKYDIIDGNHKCVYNLYSDDYYNTKSPPCIQ
jgi:parallel beta-helix repeat protein